MSRGRSAPPPDTRTPVMHSSQGSVLEIDLGIELEEGQSKSDTEALEGIYVTSAARKRKVEIRERDLTERDQALFKEAKLREWQQWLNHDVIAAASRQGVPKQRIIRARWVLSVKRSGEHKARLVLVGFTDPDLHKLDRDAPTLSQLCEHLVIQQCASRRWHLKSWDVRTAFLSGDFEDRALYMDVPADLRRYLDLSSSEVFRLRKSAYGFVNAPKAWFTRLDRELRSLGFVPFLLDQCIILYRLYRSDGSGELAGLLGCHVDDLLGGGDASFDAAMSALARKVEFGSAESGTFVYRGRRFGGSRRGSRHAPHRSIASR